MVRGSCAVILCLGMLARVARADPDERDGMPEPVIAGRDMSGTLLPETGKQVRFAVVGDYGVLAPAPEAVASMIRSWDPEFIVTTGDNNYGAIDYADLLPAVPGMQTGWDEYVGRYYGDYIQRRNDGRYSSLSGTVQRFFPCIGNHDHAGLSGVVVSFPPPLAEEGYRDFFHLNPGGAPRLPVDRGAVHTEFVSYYALRKGPVDFFMLDSNQPFLPNGEGIPATQAQNAWLESAARASTARWKLAVFHHPPPRAFQAPWDWISPERLQLCDAVLAGHVHVYERIMWNGTPVLITGNGGANIFPRFQPFFPDTLAVDDRRHGALCAMAGVDYLVFEARSLDSVTGEERLADRVVLGDAAAVPDDADEYTFFAEPGESVIFETRTESPALDPKLTLCGPDGRVAARDSNRAADGKNARLSASITRAGRWKLKIEAESNAGGAYHIHAELHRPGDDYAAWSANQPAGRRGPEDDANSDGISNLITYALTPHGRKWGEAGLEVSAIPGAAVLRLPVPPLMRQGVALAVETATAANEPVWVTLAERRPFSAWFSPANLPLNMLPPTGGRQTLQIVLPGSGVRRFFRMRATLVP